MSLITLSPLEQRGNSEVRAAEQAIPDNRMNSICERSAPVDFFKKPNINSYIISFLGVRQIVSVIRLVNKVARDATENALRTQLLPKTSMHYLEVEGYQKSLRYAEITSVLLLCEDRKNHKSNLEQLDLSVDYDYHSFIIDDALLNQFVALLPNLGSLILEGNRDLTEEGLRTAFARCSKLHSLSLENCFQLTDGISRALVVCPYLKTLILSCCYLITDEAVKESVPFLSHLNALNLSGCHLITDEALKAIAASCSHLNSLDLVGCDRITGEGVIAVATSCELKSLFLSAEQITEEKIMALAPLLSHLTTLHLSGPRLIEDEEVIKRVIAQCSELNSLTLSYCNQLTEINTILERCPYLNSVNLWHCNGIKNDALIKLEADYPTLCIHVDGVPLATLLENTSF